MTFLDKLKANIGGLVRIKTELYWYKAGKWEEVAERVCLLVDAREQISPDLLSAMATASTITARRHRVAVLLFIDGVPKWVWLYESSLELIK